MSLQDVASLQIKLTDLRGRHINVIFSRQIISAADKSVSVRKHLQDAVGLNTAVQLIYVMNIFIAGIS